MTALLTGSASFGIATSPVNSGWEHEQEFRQGKREIENPLFLVIVRLDCLQVGMAVLVCDRPDFMRPKLHAFRDQMLSRCLIDSKLKTSINKAFLFQHRIQGPGSAKHRKSGGAFNCVEEVLLRWFWNLGWDRSHFRPAIDELTLKTRVTAERPTSDLVYPKFRHDHALAGSASKHGPSREFPDWRFSATISIRNALSNSYAKRGFSLVNVCGLYKRGLSSPAVWAPLAIKRRQVYVHGIPPTKQAFAAYATVSTVEGAREP